MFNFIILLPSIFLIQKNNTIVPQKLKNLIIIIALDMTSFFIAYVISLKHNPIYTVNKTIGIYEYSIIYCVNTLVSFVSVLFMGYKLICYMYKNAQTIIERNHMLSNIANFDPLTRLLNRRSMEVKLAQAEKSFTEELEPFSVLMLDIDFFKKINDTYGHSCGDQVLKSISSIIQGQLRFCDSACRWGGEEFLILLRGTGRNEAMAVGERIRKNIQDTDTEYNQQKISHTVTVGVATINIGDSLDILINRADDKLYVGKKNGRNRVVI